MYCYHCAGLPSPQCQAQACPMCGKKNTIPQNESANLYQILSYDVGLFVGTQSFFYVRNHAKSRHWNWSAFVFGGYWLLYRGMYAYLLAYLTILVPLLYTAYYYIWTSTDVMGSILKIFMVYSIARCVLALCANYLYLHFAAHKIHKLYNEYPDDTKTRDIKIMLAGRTNLYFPIALSLLPIISLLFALLYYVSDTYTAHSYESPVLKYCFNFFRYLLGQHFTASMVKL